MDKTTFKKSDILRVNTWLARIFETLDDEKTYTIEVKQARKRRSLDANAYFWALCGDLSAVTHKPPREIYRELIRDVGGNSVIVPIRYDAVNTWISNWEDRGDGWTCEELTSKLDGYVNVQCFYGASTYDSRQMGRLIDLLIEECKAQGIETLPPAELERLCQEWRER